MTDLKDKDVNSGLGTGSKDFRIQTKLLSTSGAGVNADSNVNKAFATCDPLSELVWAPDNGLSLKCANPRADDNKPFLLWNVGPSSAEGPSTLQRIIQNPAVDQGNLTIPQSALVADDIFIVKASGNGYIPELGPSHGDGLESNRKTEDGIDKKREENCMVDPCPPQTVQTDIIVVSREEIAAVVPAAPSKKLESSAENNMRLRQTENALPAEEACMSSRICLYQDKGKGKALSDGDIYRRLSDDEDDSHESAESSNSGLSIKGIKRQIYDTDVIIGSKRIKKQIHGSDGLTSIIKPDSSFMKWISNMTKGLSESNNEESLNFLPLACSNDDYSKNYSANISMGFQTIFQSMHYRDTDASNTEVKKVVEPVEEELREHTLDDEKSPFGNSSEHTMLCNKEVDNLAENVASEDPVSSRAKDGDETKVTTKEECSDMPVATSVVLERSNPRTSLWITRLSTKTLRSEKDREMAEEAIECSTSCPKADLESQANVETKREFTDSKTNASIKEIINLEASFEVKTVSKLPSKRFRSEAMASVFARRLDALRHITSSKKGTYSTWSHTCLYCGGCHEVRECPCVTKAELEDLLLKMHTFDSRRAADSSCLCIRCSKSDHWAVSCPVAPSSRQRISDEKASIGARGLQLYTDCGRDQNIVQKSAIFDAIRNLRLTRADILRWMNSDVPLSHLNGFFLRLRLGSLEAGLGGSSYYVACITVTGDVGENNCSTSKKSIFVDVGGIKSVVTSRYVSNHDFLEDEIMAWWRRTVGSGCRIPSLAELNSKFTDRQTLGF